MNIVLLTIIITPNLITSLAKFFKSLSARYINSQFEKTMPNDSGAKWSDSLVASTTRWVMFGEDWFTDLFLVTYASTQSVASTSLKWSANNPERRLSQLIQERKDIIIFKSILISYDTEN